MIEKEWNQEIVVRIVASGSFQQDMFPQQFFRGGGKYGDAVRSTRVERNVGISSATMPERKGKQASSPGVGN